MANSSLWLGWRGEGAPQRLVHALLGFLVAVLIVWHILHAGMIHEKAAPADAI
jgi:hypothetical protein